jgi:hypothetical protein
MSLVPKTENERYLSATRPNERYLSATPDSFSTFFVSAQVALMLDYETNPNSFLD